MFANLPIPPSYCLIRKRNTYLLLKETVKDFFLDAGIENIEGFLKRRSSASSYVRGRTDHLLLPLNGGGRTVVRRYSHGGLLRAFNRSLYLAGSRAFSELALTERIRSCGIPTVEPLAAIHCIVVPPLYRAYLLTREIPRAIDFISYFKGMSARLSVEQLSSKRGVIRSAGRLLRTFHDAGFFHGDLQMKNILLSGEQPLLIDFDRSYRKSTLSTGERIKNLLRLNRSADKWMGQGLRITRTDRWRFFKAYAEEDAEILASLQKALRLYPFWVMIHRMGWK